MLTHTDTNILVPCIGIGMNTQYWVNPSKGWPLKMCNIQCQRGVSKVIGMVFQQMILKVFLASLTLFIHFATLNYPFGLKMIICFNVTARISFSRSRYNGVLDQQPCPTNYLSWAGTIICIFTEAKNHTSNFADSPFGPDYCSSLIASLTAPSNLHYYSMYFQHISNNCWFFQNSIFFFFLHFFKFKFVNIKMSYTYINFKTKYSF